MVTAAKRGWTQWVQEYIDGCDNPDFRAYAHGKSATEERYVWMIGHLIELGRMQNGRVLDIGCGFGWDAAAISLKANATVFANDIRPEMTSVVKERVEAINKLGAGVKIETLTGDICNVALPANSFDAIICQQTIEHVRDLDAMFAVCFRLLKPNGRAIFTNDNNVFNRASFLKEEEMWKRRDTDWTFIEELKRQRPIENRDIKPYAVMRKEIIQGINPSLNQADVDRIAQATAGLTEKEITPIVRTYTKGERLPIPPYSSWCRNPITGEYCERQLNPFELAEDLSAQGFVAQVRHGFRRWPLRWLNSVPLPWLNKTLFNYRSYFMVVGVKPT